MLNNPLDIILWWRQEPLVFAQEVLGINLWSKQKEILEAVRDEYRIAVRSCSAMGKTLLAAAISLWFITCFRPSTVLTTGKSFRQVQEQLWREIRRLHAQAKIPIGGDITQTRLDLGENWFALGFSTDEPERITGFHNENVLVIIDEGSGIPDAVYGAIENPLAAGNCKLLIMGNPTQNIGKFAEAFANPTYKTFHISALDTPNLKDEEGFPFLVSKRYVEEKRQEWGEDSPLYEVYILGDFPSGESDRLIPFGLAEMAINRDVEVKDDDIIAMGVDTARFGDDENALYVRKGSKVIDRFFWKKARTEETIGKIVHMINKHDPALVNIDEGYNPGVVDGLRKDGYKVNGVKFQGKPKNEKLFANIRAEIFWNLANRFKAGEIQIPGDKTLLKQVTDIKKKPLNRYDQIIIESKEEMKHRGVHSPDRADALALCFMETSGKELSIRWI
jgi:phage terminase large subunit